MCFGNARGYGLLQGLITIGLWLFGCSGENSQGDETISEASKPEESLVSDELLKKTWVFRMSDDALRAPFEGDAGWTAYFNRNYSDAADSLEGEGLARIHAEIASVYRQAVLVHANATNHNYGTDRQDEDANDSLYLRGVSKIFLNDFAGGREDLAKVEDEKLKSYAVQWLAFTDENRKEEALIEANFANVPKKLDAQAKFRVESLPHFKIRTTIEGAESAVTDATELWVRSIWHENLAKSLVKDPNTIQMWLEPWRLPFEKHVAIAEDARPKLDDSWGFLSPYLVTEDLYFIYDLEAEGTSALEKCDKKSLLATVLLDCMEKDGSKDVLKVAKVLNAAGKLEQRLNEEMKISSGKEQPFFPLFADFAEQAVLRAGVLVADANEQYRDAGKLRINANDLAFTNSQDPVFLVSFAAWDVGNRYPLRAQQTLHRYDGDFPALKIAGHPLGTLQIRLGKTAASGAAN